MESLLPVWITSIASCCGVIYAIVRNGSRGKKKDEELKTELKLEVGTINKKLDDPVNGLSAIKKAADGMKLHCAEVSTRIEAQVKTNTKEIVLLREKKR